MLKTRNIHQQSDLRLTDRLMTPVPRLFGYIAIYWNIWPYKKQLQSGHNHLYHMPLHAACGLVLRGRNTTRPLGMLNTVHMCQVISKSVRTIESPDTRNWAGRMVRFFNIPPLFQITLIESNMGRGVSQVCPTQGPARVPTPLLARGLNKPVLHPRPC